MSDDPKFRRENYERYGKSKITWSVRVHVLRCARVTLRIAPVVVRCSARSSSSSSSAPREYARRERHSNGTAVGGDVTRRVSGSTLPAGAEISVLGDDARSARARLLAAVGARRKTVFSGLARQGQRKRSRSPSRSKNRRPPERSSARARPTRSSGRRRRVEPNATRVPHVFPTNYRFI